MSFPDDAVFYKQVYGFFEGGVTTHFECDQQVARVRNPGEVKLFISPRNMSLEHDPEIVEHDLRESPLFAFLEGSDPSLELSKVEDDVLALLIPVECRRRASVNNFRANYIAYKRATGWNVDQAELNPELAALGAAAMQVGTAQAENQKILRLLDARVLKEDDLRMLIEKEKRGSHLSRDELAALDRARYENFYRREIFDQLILLEEKVHLSDKVRSYEALAAGSLAPPYRRSEALTPSDRARIYFLGDAFRSAGVYGDYGFDEDAVFTDNTLDKFKEFMRANKAFYEAQFGKNVRNDLDKAPAIQLNHLLEACRLKSERAGTVTKDGKKTYQYRLSSVRLRGLRRLHEIRREVSTSWPEIDSF